MDSREGAVTSRRWTAWWTGVAAAAIVGYTVLTHLVHAWWTGPLMTLAVLSGWVFLMVALRRKQAR